jgi:hypothetical protein
MLLAFFEITRKAPFIFNKIMITYHNLSSCEQEVSLNYQKKAGVPYGHLYELTEKWTSIKYW